AGYTPNFALPGTYYVVCVSTNQYNDSVTSNEVQVDVANGSTIATQAVSGSPYYVSDSANNIVAVDFTSDAVFNNGNTFTAQLSDNNGNFTNAVNIGTLNAASVGTISALIPNNSVAGTHYRIRVVSSNPVITGSDNGSDLTIIPFEISVAPLDTQRLAINQSGNTLMASSTHPVSAYRWQWALNSGLSYSDFSPVQTEDTLSPHFASAHTYYVVCKLTNAQNATITSQEVVVMVTQSTGVSGVAEAYVKAYWNGNDFVVDMSNAKLQAPAIEMVNVTGQQIISQKLVNGAINRISNNLPAGLYLFRITDGSKVYCGKSMKLN
ncbi:MAG TPA: T9SS type A sorting domain-containing protein, partial [Chitinophagales bacterium]|nr:T9SS type A sorting domain-containing protein [Chitinophagales bacterium]